MRVDINPNLYTQEVQDSHQGQKHTDGTAKTTASLAAAQLATMRNESFTETQENASLFFANQAKKIQLGKNDKDLLVNSLQSLLEQMDAMGKEVINRAAEQLSKFKDADDIMGKLNQSGMAKGDVALVLSALLGFKGLDASVKKALKKRLQELMEEQDIDLEILAAANGTNLDKNGLNALKHLYQRAKRGEQGLSHWFEQLSRHKNRKKYIAILIRALSEPLDQGQKRDDLTMVAATIIDLRRLLIFLTFEDHCKLIAHAHDISENAVKVATLEILDQSWCYPDYLANLINELGINTKHRIFFLKRWHELFRIMRIECFREEAQKEQIEEAFMQLNDQWIE